MNPFNRKNYKNAPMVEEAYMTVEPNREARVAKSEHLRRVEMQKEHLAMQARRKAVNAQRADNARREIQAYKNAKMHERSLKTPHQNKLLEMALMQKFTPVQGGQTTKNELMGFLPAVPMKQGETAYDPDFSVYKAVPAQEFSNHLRAKDLHYKDYPLVQDASHKGDFSGVLLSEKGSPDFSTMIVNDVDRAFGRLPRRRRR